MEIILYTIHCPRCNVLEKKLNMKNVNFTTMDNEDKMIEMGIKSSPMLSVDGVLYDFNAAVQWINNYGGDE